MPYWSVPLYPTRSVISALASALALAAGTTTPALASGLLSSDAATQPAHAPAALALAASATARSEYAAKATRRGGLDSEVRNALNVARLGAVDVSVSIIDCDSNQELAGLNERSPVMPASNLKLLTSGTALITLGKDFKFTTKFNLAGDKLIIVGDGDPGLADPKLLADGGTNLSEFADALVGELKARGAKSIREVILDDRIFERAWIQPSWPKNQLDAWYAAPVTGLNFYTNCMEFFVTPGPKPGSTPTIKTSPNFSQLEVRNTARTGSADSTDLRIAKGSRSGSYTISGSVAPKYRAAEPFEVTMQDPPLTLGGFMADRLTSAGLAATDGIKVRMVDEGEQLPEATTAAVIATPIAAALRRCNVNSQNLYAECLLKRAGRAVSGQPGSWQNGAAVARMLVGERLGIDSGELIIADGSGLSRDNRITTFMLASWLTSLARDEKLGPAFIASMADQSAGKIADRFHKRTLNNLVHAKTGFISGVQSLSGYVTNVNTGRRIAYSVIINNTQKASPGARVKEFHEDVVQIIDRHLTK